jgi:hypothetical protein
MIDETEIRNQVRVFLAVRPEEPMAEPYLLLGLNQFFPEEIKAAEMMTALRWNEARGFVERLFNRRLSRDEWKLTKRGLREEGL